MHRVFVYGTLMAGESNHPVLADAPLLGPARTAPGYTLYNFGPYPGMVAEGAGTVLGELYAVEDHVISALDHLEGHPTFYRRTPITLDSGEEALTYLLRPDQVAGLPVIPSGDWRHHSHVSCPPSRGDQRR